MGSGYETKVLGWINNFFPYIGNNIKHEPKQLTWFYEEYERM